MLDVGCGTGRLEAALADRAKVWGVDAEPAMLEVARANVPAGTFKEARAEELPFKDGWFERVVMWLSSHLVDRRRAFAEANRVLGADGRLAVVTFDPSYFATFWLNRLFPSMRQVDLRTLLDRRGARGRAAGGRLRGSRAHAPLPDRRPRARRGAGANPG